jgi:hypothetical protein
MATLREYTILVPLLDNAGEPFGPETFAQMEAELVARFGGFTRQDGMAGAWADRLGTVYRDRLCSDTVATAARNGKEQVITLARHWCLMLKQLAVYVRLPGGQA